MCVMNERYCNDMNEAADYQLSTFIALASTDSCSAGLG